LIPSVSYYDEENQEWVNIGGIVSGHTIIVSVDHLTKFAVFGITPDPFILEPAAPFTDIRGHWAEQEITEAASFGWVSGYPDHSFRPEDPVTRVQFITMLVQALQLENRDTLTVYKDADHIPNWAHHQVNTATAAGLIQGYLDHTFQPERKITRTEIIVMLLRSFQFMTEEQPPEDLSETTFTDDGQIPLWAKNAALITKQLGIVQGRNGNRLEPNQLATRAESVVMILRLLEHIK
jgi:hypothetical protein